MSERTELSHFQVEPVLDKYYLRTWPLRLGPACLAAAFATYKTAQLIDELLPEFRYKPVVQVVTAGIAGISTFIAAFCTAGWFTREAALYQTAKEFSTSYSTVRNTWGGPHLNLRWAYRFLLPSN